jgi:hypothetical protein
MCMKVNLAKRTADSPQEDRSTGPAIFTRTRPNNMSDPDLGQEGVLSALLLEDPVDLDKLRDASRGTGGFLNAGLRRRIWPKILGLNFRGDDAVLASSNMHVYDEADQRFTNQIQIDIERSLWNLEELKDVSEDDLEKERGVLEEIMLALFSRNPQCVTWC